MDWQAGGKGHKGWKSEKEIGKGQGKGTQMDGSQRGRCSHNKHLKLADSGRRTRLDRCEGEHLGTEEQEASRNVKPYTGTPTEGKVKPNTGTPSDHAKPNTGASPSLTMEDGEDL